MAREEEVLLALYNRKIEKKGKEYVYYDPILNLNIPVTKLITFFKNEEIIEEDLTLTKLGKDAVMKVLEKKLKR